jgi:hypothetical protein
MAELTVEEAKKELTGIVDKAKQGVEQGKEKLLSEEERKSLETKKSEEAKAEEVKKQSVEAQILKDKAILAKPDTELKDEEKKRKEEILKAEEARLKADEDKLPAEEKIKRIQEKTQKRIDEISSELKETRNKSEKETSALRQELDNLRKEKNDLETKLHPPKDEELIIAEVEKAYTDTQYKNLEEDKDKPIEQRREMTQEDWDEWYLKDPKAATAWEIRQETRRIDEKKKEITKKTIEKRTQVFLDEVDASVKRTLKTHPDLDITKREAELKAQGKSKDEIKEIILAENPKSKLCYDIMLEHPEWLQKPNAPELVVAEMEKRLAGKDSKSVSDSRVEALEKKLADLEEKLADAEARAGLDEGISSTPKGESKKTILTDGEKNLIEIMQSKGASQEKIDSALKKYRESKK